MLVREVVISVVVPKQVFLLKYLCIALFKCGKFSVLEHFEI
jgi:hypothetical protein